MSKGASESERGGAEGHQAEPACQATSLNTLSRKPFAHMLTRQ